MKQESCKTCIHSSDTLYGMYCSYQETDVCEYDYCLGYKERGGNDETKDINRSDERIRKW